MIPQEQRSTSTRKQVKAWLHLLAQVTITHRTCYFEFAVFLYLKFILAFSPTYNHHYIEAADFYFHPGRILWEDSRTMGLASGLWFKSEIPKKVD